ncbi:MAG: T9SS type A sorting domain-containing protein [Bacteroidetes bacterium]|nr:T9SS type A sorting domain-containing protein [Bacteroidota bacterium]
MNKKYLLLFVIALCCFFSRSQAQMYYYLVAPITATYTPVAGTPISVTGTMNDGYATGIPIGFNFYFDGSPTPYTTVDVSTNGFASLGSPLTNSTPANNLTSGLIGPPNSRPIVAPLWDDLDLTAFGGAMSYATTGSAPNRVFTVEWSNVTWPYAASNTSATATLSFEMKFYETTNYIDFIYNNIATSPSTGSQSASIGLAETGNGSFISLNSTGANPATSYATETSTVNGVFVSGTVYHFEYCPPPTLTHSNVTINSFVSTWTPTIAGQYDYAMDSVWTANPVNWIPTTNLTRTFTNLMPNSTYYVYVRSNCGNNHTSPWVIDTIHTLMLPPCLAPLGLTVFGVTYTTADFVWTSVPGAMSYQWVLDQSPVTPFVQGTPTALTYHWATGLQPNTTYYFHLRTDCSWYPTDTSAWETVSFTTMPLPPCPMPTGLYSNNVTNTTADLGWNSQSGIIGWEFALDLVPANPVVGALSTTNSITATGLTSLTQYYLHVRTDCSTYPNDTSGWALYSFITGPDSCTQPTNLQLSFVDQFTAFASWNAAPGAYGYEYLVNQDPNPPTSGGTPTFSTFHSITGLASSTMYYLHVRTVCDTAYYGNNYTQWIVDSFQTQPGLSVSNVVGNGDFIVAAYPNPVSNTATVSIVGTQKGSSALKLMDITGKLIKAIPVDGRERITIDMADLSAGLYLLRYSDDEQSYTLRLTKQ